MCIVSGWIVCEFYLKAVSEIAELPSAQCSAVGPPEQLSWLCHFISLSILDRLARGPYSQTPWHPASRVVQSCRGLAQWSTVVCVWGVSFRLWPFLVESAGTQDRICGSGVKLRKLSPGASESKGTEGAFFQDQRFPFQQWLQLVTGDEES